MWHFLVAICSSIGAFQLRFVKSIVSAIDSLDALYSGTNHVYYLLALEAGVNNVLLVLVFLATDHGLILFEDGVKRSASYMLFILFTRHLLYLVAVYILLDKAFAVKILNVLSG